jgi:hypothetical protein
MKSYAEFLKGYIDRKGSLISSSVGGDITFFGYSITEKKNLSMLEWIMRNFLKRIGMPLFP